MQPQSIKGAHSMAFEPGSIVQLKSGGAPMTVSAVDSAGVHCVWYAESTDDIKTDVIPAICLEALEAEEDEDAEDEDD
jgi:uncharacterized protein YodC (DUF2158 family)